MINFIFLRQSKMPSTDEKLICKMCHKAEVESHEERINRDDPDELPMYEFLCYNCADTLDFNLRCLAPTLNYLLQPIKKNIQSVEPLSTDE